MSANTTLLACATCGAAKGEPCAGWVLYDFNAQEPIGANDRSQSFHDGFAVPAPCRNGRARMAARSGTACHDCGTPTDYREADDDGRCPRCQERSNVTCPECLEHYQHHAPKCRVGAMENRVRATFARLTTL